MEKESLIKFLDGDTEFQGEFVDFVKEEFCELIERVEVKYPGIKENVEKEPYIENDAIVYVLDVMVKYRYIWEERDNHVKMIKHMLVRFLFAENYDKKWKQEQF